MLDNIKQSVAGVFDGKRANMQTIGITVVLVAIFIALSFFIYKKYVVPMIRTTDYVENTEFVKGGVGGSGSVDVYYFYTEWCPHCKKGRPMWDDFKKSHGSGEINGRPLFFHEVDCDKDSVLADKFNVSSYPTIKLVSGKNIHEYDAKPDVANLNKFLNSSV